MDHSPAVGMNGYRDGTLRDVASLHGSFRKVAETQAALELAAATLAGLRVAECHWSHGGLQRTISAHAHSGQTQFEKPDGGLGRSRRTPP